MCIFIRIYRTDFTAKGDSITRCNRDRLMGSTNISAVSALINHYGWPADQF